MAATEDELREVNGIGKKTIEGLRSWDPQLALSLVTLMTDAPIDLESLFKPDDSWLTEGNENV